MNWVEAYIKQVVGYLPETEQAEVEKELYSNIMDMLPENPTVAEIKAVLTEMGNPRKLAEEYRQKPRYLIGPAVYSDYVRALKVIVPLTAVVGAVIGGVVAYFEQMLHNMSMAAFSEVLSEAIGSGISLALQGIIWVTIGFVIFERSGMLKSQKDDWQVESLFAKTPVAKKIQLGDILVELVVLIGIVGFLLFGTFANFSFVETNSSIVIPIFEQSFADFAIMLIIASCLVDIFMVICKLRYRRWNLIVTVSSIFASIFSAISFIWICAQNPLFSSEMVTFLRNEDWAQGDILHFFSENGSGQGLPAPIFNGIAILCVLGTSISIIVTLYRYYRQKKIEKNFSVEWDF